MRNENNIIEKKDIDTLYEYLINIKKFEETLNQTDDYIIIKKDFYLINLLDYNIFKEQIKYESLAGYITNEKDCKEEIKQYLNDNEIIMEKIEKIKLIDTTKLDFKNIYSEQYKIINDILATVICDCEQNEINNRLCFSLDYPRFHIKEKKVDLLYYDYIIDKRLIFTHDNKEILYTSKAIIEYYKLYNYFKLNGKKDNKEKYYLTKTENTNNILTFISKHGEFDFNQENIIYRLIEYITNNRDSEEIKNLFKLEILNFKTKDEFKKYNESKKKDISIINEYLYFLIKNNKENITKKDLSYYCYQELDGVIHIEFKDKTEVKFTPFDNILKSNNRIHKGNLLTKGLHLIKKIYSSSKKFVKNIACLCGLIKNEKETKEKYLIDEDDNISNYSDKEIKSGEFAFTLIEKDENENEQEEPLDIKMDDDFEVINQKNKKEIKLFFRECPGIGLQNIGATCYMNATLQCFAHIEKFVNFFKYNSQVNKSQNINDIVKSGENKTNLLFPSFKILIENLWPDNYQTLSKKYYAPNDFKNKISEMNPLFQGIAANDSKDLVNFIIMTLHEEFNKVKNNNINTDAPLIDQTNQQLVLKNFLEDFANKNQSIISDLFYALNYTITECTVCKTKLYNYQIYFFIIFPLEEVRKYKLNNQFNFNTPYNNNMFMNNYNNFNYNNNNFLLNNKTVNIYDCFDYDKKINYMSGSNAMYCNKCRVNCNCTMQTFLAAGPQILILLLNRGKGKEFDVKIDFYEEINLLNYIEYNGTGYKYKLIGVISHIGESGMGGHFIAYCRDPIQNKWNKFNDAIVTEVVDFQNEVINFAMPYLLFYQKYND